MAAEAASFNTSILSISLGFIEFKELKGTPSTTYNGSLEEFIDPTPLMRIETLPPGCPLFCVTCTPANRPCKAWSNPVTGVPAYSLELTEETAPAMFAFFCVPYPITTTSSVFDSARFSDIFRNLLLKPGFPHFHILQTK
jgi:hypothetical protein